MRHKHPLGGPHRHDFTPPDPLDGHFDPEDDGPRRRHRHRGDFPHHGRHPHDDDPPGERFGPERGHRRHRHHGGRHGGPRRGGRLFDYGDLRLLLLAMIAEQPRHGYELIKQIEERLGGSYSPSPGVIYPTLSWLDDMGYAVIDAEPSGRKRYRITAEGEAFLTANRPAVDALLARLGAAEADGPPRVPPSVVRAMENLKVAMRLRLRQGPLDDEAAAKIAAALDAAAQSVEKS